MGIRNNKENSVIPIKVTFPTPSFSMIMDDKGIIINVPSAKQKSAIPNCASSINNFALTAGIYNTHVPVIIFNDAKTQAGPKYRNFVIIKYKEFKMYYLTYLLYIKISYKNTFILIQNILILR